MKNKTLQININCLVVNSEEEGCPSDIVQNNISGVLKSGVSGPIASKPSKEDIEEVKMIKKMFGSSIDPMMMKMFMSGFEKREQNESKYIVNGKAICDLESNT